MSATISLFWNSIQSFFTSPSLIGIFILIFIITFITLYLQDFILSLIIFIPLTLIFLSRGLIPLPIYIIILLLVAIKLFMLLIELLRG